MNVKRERIQIVIAGLIIGVIASLLVFFGNPSNMGFCIACFLRDTAGGLGLHRAAAVQYIRLSRRSSPPRAAALLSPGLCWASS